ncbi:MAG: methyltransferase [Lachnospiraceae bacterium]|nr:methyltransferase [Lachnospiraceae bacterium]
MNRLKELCKDKKVRQSLSQIREALSEGVLPEEELLDFVNADSILDYEALFQNDDAKVRKNLALLIGDIEPYISEEHKMYFSDLLMKYYQLEETLFVKESYVKGLASYDITAYKEVLKNRLEELQNQEHEQAELKHVRGERKQLEKILSSTDAVERKFSYTEQEFELLLTADELIRDGLAQFFHGARVSASGVRIRSNEWKKIYSNGLYNEVLYLIPMKRGTVLTKENAGSVLADSKLKSMLDQLLTGGAPYHFRIQWKGLPEEHKPASKEIGFVLEEASKGVFQNVPSDYDVEIQFQIRKDGTLAPFFRLPMMEIERFAYRREFLPTSTAPATAAAMVSLAGKYMRRDAQIIDPFCGVGTLLIERHRFIHAREIYGLDTYGDAIRSARVNTEAAGMHANYINRDYFDFKHDYLFDEVITEFPDLFAKEPEEREAFYKSFFKKTMEITTEDAVLILLSNEEKLIKKLVRLSSDYRMEQVIDFRKRSKIFILRRK